MFIQTEFTPNPNAMKFFPGKTVGGERLTHFDKVEDTTNASRLASLLFNISGDIRSVFFGEDFITITKYDEVEWDILRPGILMIIMDHFLAELHIYDELHNASLDLTDLSEIEKQIVEIIETRVRPSVAMDGGDIVYRSFENGIVKLELRGACSGCPSSTLTLKRGIESMLKHFVPEVESVEAVEGE